MKAILTIKDIAEITGLTPVTIWGRVKRAAIPRERINVSGRITALFKRADVSGLINHALKNQAPPGGLTAKEVAALAGVRPETVTQHIRKKILKAGVIDGGNGIIRSYRIDKKDAEIYAEWAKNRPKKSKGKGKGGGLKREDDGPVDAVYLPKRNPDCKKYEKCLDKSAHENSVFGCDDCQKYEISKSWASCHDIGRKACPL